jgi:hypothetical protein
MPPFVFQQDCDNPSHLVMRPAGTCEKEDDTKGLSPRRFL